MRRRSYLAAAAIGTLAGCLATDGNDQSDEDDEDDAEEPVAGPDDGETFDDFERLGNWSVAAGSLHQVTEDAVAGSQSALLRSDGADRVRIVRELSSPVDLSGRWPGLALATDAPTSPTIRLIDADGDWIDFRHRPGANTELVRANFGIDGVEGEPDLGRTTEIVLEQWVGEEAETQLWIDDLQFLSGPSTGRVMIGFDGGFEGEYTVGFPILEEWGYPATTFVNTETLREEPHHEGNRLAVPQMEELVEADWTVASRGALEAEYPTLSEEEQAALIEEAVDWLESRGFEGAAYFSYPRGGYDDTTLELVGSSHELGFASGYPVTARIANPLLCSKLVEPDVETAKTAIDRTAEFGGITALFYRRPGPAAWEDFEETIAHLASLETENRLAVATPRQLETTHLH